MKAWMAPERMTNRWHMTRSLLHTRLPPNLWRLLGPARSGAGVVERCSVAQKFRGAARQFEGVRVPCIRRGGAHAREWYSRDTRIKA